MMLPPLYSIVEALDLGWNAVLVLYVGQDI